MRSRSLFILILGLTVLGLKSCLTESDPTEPADEPICTFIVVTIDGILVENITWELFDWPLEIKLTNDLSDSTFTGEVKLAKFGWNPIRNCTKPCMFVIDIDTLGKLGPVEFIAFYDISIDSDIMQGSFANAGPTLDTGVSSFIAVK